MKSRLITFITPKRAFRTLLLITGLCALWAVPALSSARPQPAGITIANNSSWEIRHLYLSPANSDEWGPDQLNNSVIAPGGSYVLSNVSCGASEIKVVSEDQDGCFLSKIVSCTSDATWTITNDATPDCGN